MKIDINSIDLDDLEELPKKEKIKKKPKEKEEIMKAIFLKNKYEHRMLKHSIINVSMTEAETWVVLNQCFEIN